MELYRVKLTPTSSFLTTLKGDTLFGQLCWALRYLEGETRLDKLLEGYTEGKPFVVVSDAFPIGLFPKPHLPMEILGEDPELKKENRKRRWLDIESLQKGLFSNALSDKKAKVSFAQMLEVHNAINYKTSRTGDGFDPFSYAVIDYPEMEFYCLIDSERMDVGTLEKAISFIGESGYGKKSTVGKGRFVFEGMEPVSFNVRGKAFMSLSPLVLDGLDAKAVYYDTFVRFGKHGSLYARRKAFKKPVLMADTGCVVCLESEEELHFMGKGITGLSDVYPKTVHQGYAITIAVGVNHAKL